MPENSVKQVMIDNRLIGIVGLEEVIEKAKIACPEKSDVGDFRFSDEWDC